MVAQTWDEVVSGDATARVYYVVSRRLDVADGEMWLPAAVCRTELEAGMLTEAFGGIIKAVPMVEVAQ